MKSTFSVIYYLKRQVVKKDGTVPVMGRITVGRQPNAVQLQTDRRSKLWDTKGGRVTGRSSAALETNRMLDKMRVRINKHYQEIMERDNFVTAEKVKNAFLGLEHRYHTLMQVFRQHNEDYEKQVDAGMKAKGTLLKYRTVYKHLQEFLTIRYRVKDIALKELTPAFISDFEMFLRTDKHCCTNTVWLYVCPLRTMVFIAINNEWLTRDPFREYEIKKEETTRSFLTKEEIRLLMEGRLKNAKQELYPRPLPVLRLHGPVVRRHAQPDGREHPYLLRRTRVDKHQPPEDGRGVQYPPARHRKAHHRQIPGSVRERQDFPRSPLQHVPCRNPFRRQALRHHQAHHVASEPTHGSHDGVPLQRRTHRNGQFHAGTPRA